MAREIFRSDLAEARSVASKDISDLRSGEDAEFSFTYRCKETEQTATIFVVLSDLSDYPHQHTFLVFTDEDSPPFVAAAVADPPDTASVKVQTFLVLICKHLDNAEARIASGTRQTPQDNEQPDTAMSNYEHQSGPDDNDDGFDSVNTARFAFRTPPSASTLPYRPAANAPADPELDLLRRDLLSAKDKGFRVGLVRQPHPSKSCVVSISVCTSKLALTEETMRAWSVRPNEYLVLLIYYPHGYRTLGALQTMTSPKVSDHVKFRVALSDFYKAKDVREASDYFSKDSTDNLRECFISRPLHALFNERFLHILSYRMSEDLSWTGAEKYYDANLGASNNQARPGEYFYHQHDGKRHGFVGTLTQDVVTPDSRPADLSLPLVAMQFLLRHFIGCTWFCQVCHIKIDKTCVRAIKPYVCDKPLCLYQYMNLGLGPSVDHEVKTQPLVVDLLISFCYAAAVAHNLEEYPPLNWKVPHPGALVFCQSSRAAREHRPELQQAAALPGVQQHRVQHRPPATHRATIDVKRMRMTLRDTTVNPVKVGDWVVITRLDQNESWHCRVDEIAYSPIIGLSKGPIVTTLPEREPTRQNPASAGTSTQTAKERGVVEHKVTFHLYDTPFQNLSHTNKARAIGLLLDGMPKVSSMKAYLRGGPGRRLDKWQERMSPAHMGMLHWIIASNRSCIMQVDEVVSPQPGDRDVRLGVRPCEQRVEGVEGWLQFRFAMGSPEKEALFTSALPHGNPEYPSLFAWHGSPSYNWHSIVREGLNFDRTANGRAQGDGVYHSRNFVVSMSYSRGLGLRDLNDGVWPNSLLSVVNAIALSEIVNAPDRFRSVLPHYVVQYPDWIQTRYLFVQPADLEKVRCAPDRVNMDELPQDPSMTPLGPFNQRLRIPWTAIPKSRHPKSHRAKSRGHSSSHASSSTSVVHRSSGTRRDPVVLDANTEDDGISVKTLEEDREFLGQSKETRAKASEAKSPGSEEARHAAPTRPPLPVVPVTAFRTRPLGNVPIMAAPSHGARQANLTLQRSYHALLMTQNEHVERDALAELGWYIDVKHISETGNLYQWIVSLHSFPLDLPLARDMNTYNVESIVLEMRFPSNYPCSPPFIRIVSPRFIPFAHGGGGHVTAGGSVCMDLLTSSGWSPGISIESILLTIRLAITSVDPRPARLEHFTTGHHSRAVPAPCYGLREAADAFVRACRAHGWRVPAEFDQMMAGY